MSRCATNPTARHQGMQHKVSVFNHGLCIGADDTDGLGQDNATSSWCVAFVGMACIVALLCLANIRIGDTHANDSDVELGQQDMLHALRDPIPMPRQEPQRALLVTKHWLDEILAGDKRIEVRNGTQSVWPHISRRNEDWHCPSVCAAGIGKTIDNSRRQAAQAFP